jgi:xyloglucan-specific exo-beta-1,4-glucanase
MAVPRVSLSIPYEHSVFSHTKGNAIAGQPTSFLPHKGVLSASESALYITYSDGGGPVRPFASYLPVAFLNLYLQV